MRRVRVRRRLRTVSKRELVAFLMVYVDDMRAAYGRMKMCHMMADTHQELIDMADRIQVARRWIQKPDTAEEHFDISLTKRSLAMMFGAKEVTGRDLVTIIQRKRHAAKTAV